LAQASDQACLRVTGAARRDAQPQPLGNMPPTASAARRSVLQRWLGPMQAGSLRAGLLVLTTTAMGAGVLTLPFAIKELGWLLGSLVTVAVACLNVTSLDLLLDAGGHFQANSYSELMSRAGGRLAAGFLDLTVTAITLGANTAYFLFLKQLLPVLLATFGAPPWVATAHVVMPAVAVVVFAISLPRDITALGKFTVLGVCSVFYICGLMIVTAMVGGVDVQELRASVVDLAHVEDVPLGGATNAIALIIAGFLCQYNVFFVYSDVKEPTTRRLRKITRFSTLFQALSYLALGLSGYAAFGAETLDNVYMNFPASDLRANVGKLLVCASLCVSIPLCTFAARAQFVALLVQALPPELSATTSPVGSLSNLYVLSLDASEEQGVHLDSRLRSLSECSAHTPVPARPGGLSAQPPRGAEPLLPADREEQKVEGEMGLAGGLLHVGVTACIVLATLALAFAVPSVSFILGKLGSVCGVTQMYLMPGLVLLRCSGLRPPVQRAATLLGFFAASTVGLAALVL